ncbi:MAG: DUF1749 domain-containing protein [Clostridia bacterium]|nr:DUF1749 domain-containing protein [Clostridia bacterium]
MNIETIFFKAIDEIKLKGMIYHSNKESKNILISIHGMATNCLKQRDEEISKEINQDNIDMLVFNNRGHDLINYINKITPEGRKDILGGTAYEDISECYYDILGAIKYCLNKGYEKIYLMGHSLGSTKIVYFYQRLLKENEEKIIEHIKGIILLSLIDIPKALQVYLREEFPAMVTYAKNMKKEGMENQLMPEKSFIHPISVKTFLSYSIENKDIDFARYSDIGYDFKEINNIKIPLFMRWGNNNEMILQKAEDLCNNLKAKIKNKKLDIGFIDGANHNYSGKEKILSEQIKKFLKNL